MGSFRPSPHRLCSARLPRQSQPAAGHRPGPASFPCASGLRRASVSRPPHPCPTVTRPRQCWGPTGDFPPLKGQRLASWAPGCRRGPQYSKPSSFVTPVAQTHNYLSARRILGVWPCLRARTPDHPPAFLDHDSATPQPAALGPTCAELSTAPSRSPGRRSRQAGTEATGPRGSPSPPPAGHSQPRPFPPVAEQDPVLVTVPRTPG